jgi:hypothetical protein
LVVQVKKVTTESQVMQYGQMTIAPEVIGTYQAAAAAKHTNKKHHKQVRSKICTHIYILVAVPLMFQASTEYVQPSSAFIQ